MVAASCMALAVALTAISDGSANRPSSQASAEETLERYQQKLHRTHRLLEQGTAAGLGVTGALGTLALVNQPTLFGDGACAAGSPVLGVYGCRGLSLLHGGAGVISLTLYAATKAIELATPDWAGGKVHDFGPVHRALGWLHLLGMAIQPALGIAAAFPEVIGLTESPGRERFSRAARTVHVGIGYLTVTAYVAALFIELAKD